MMKGRVVSWVSVGTLTALLASSPASLAQRTAEQKDKLVPSFPYVDGYFGTCIDCDGTTAVIGYRNGAWVYSYNNGVWIPETLLMPPNAPTGTANIFDAKWVAVDGNTIVIGAVWVNGVDPERPHIGAAYVWERMNGIWTLHSTLMGAGHAEDLFGYSVAIDGDTIVVGAVGDDCADPTDPDCYPDCYSGSAYVFVRDGGCWWFQAKLAAPEAECPAWFGTAVAIKDNRVLVGAIGDSLTGTGHVFVREGGIWFREATLVPSVASVCAYFGQSVALTNEGAIVGAPSDTLGGDIPIGSAFVFRRSGANWSEEAKFLEQHFDSLAFGHDVALHGNTAVVGVPIWGLGTGLAYVFTRDSSGTWSEREQLHPSDLDWGDSFGNGMVLVGDELLVGAPNQDQPYYSNRGAVYVYDLHLGPCRGDSNCDGVVDWRDIDYFVAAINDNIAAWEAMFAPGAPTCAFANNDVNVDGTVSWLDIDALVARMNTVCP